MEEVAHGEESAFVRALIDPLAEAGVWRCRTRINKWNRNEDFEAGFDPDDVFEDEGNLLINAGINLMENLLIGAGGTAYTTAANAALAVGSSAAGAAATETTLDTELDRKVATAVVSGQTVTFQATFNDNDSQGAWEEAGVLNNAAAAGTLLNHKVTPLGTKGAGATWVLTMAITIA
jgi:hypothetical protein